VTVYRRRDSTGYLQGIPTYGFFSTGGGIVGDYGRIKPHMTVHDYRMVGVFHTTREPMQSFVISMK
jgi:hypothetical protein